MGQYVLKKTIHKHCDSINALAFSPDGSHFASGADDGLIVIFQGYGSGKEVQRFQVKAPVTTLLWRSRFGHTVVAGDTSGDVHTICLDGSASVSVSQNGTLFDDIPATGKPVLSYHELCPWSCPLYCAGR